VVPVIPVEVFIFSFSGSPGVDSQDNKRGNLKMKLSIAVAVSVLSLASGFPPSAHSAEPAAAASQPQLIYVSYYVLDQKRALDFYVGLLGMTERQRLTPSPGVTEIILGFDKHPATAGILLMHRADRTTPYEIGDGFSRTLIHVPDIKATMRRLTDAGVTVVRPPTEVKGLNVTYSMVHDPDGYLIEFLQHR
jgi:lactoylglutathione lyase